MKTVKYLDTEYPAFQASGNAARFAMPFAKEYIGEGKEVADVGCNRPEWGYPNATMIDLAFNDGYHAMNLPDKTFDAIFSSHFLEHYVGRFQEVIEYWLTKIADDGIIFLYLPHMGMQKYWAWGNKKHIHHLTPEMMSDFCEDLMDKNLIRNCTICATDLNYSFYCIIEK